MLSEYVLDLLVYHWMQKQESFSEFQPSSWQYVLVFHTNSSKVAKYLTINKINNHKKAYKKESKVYRIHLLNRTKMNMDKFSKGLCRSTPRIKCLPFQCLWLLAFNIRFTLESSSKHLSAFSTQLTKISMHGSSFLLARLTVYWTL